MRIIAIIIIKMMSNLPILTFFAILAIGNHPSDGGSVSGTDFQPEFAEPLENLTVAIGRDATFTCIVRGLGGYRVGWVRADSKAIQAIHTHVITHNPRVFVSHADHTMWHLTIKGVKEEDRGSYMCQINTDPMISQVATLEVVIPPEFIPEETSGDVMAPEGSTVKLTCKARGHPIPSIKWRREDGQNITLKSQGAKTQVTVHEGEVLKLQKISRADMGTYLCIAGNSVPPSISKRITVSVHFHPVIHVPNQLIGAPVNTDVTLECNVEAYPRSIHFWVKDQGNAMIISGDRYEVQEITKSMFEVKMLLIIRKFRKSDVGSYACIAKNSLGDVDSVVKLHEFKVEGGGGGGDLTDRTGSNNAFDDDDDEMSGNSYETDSDLSISRMNRNRHTYKNNKNSVVVGAGGRGVTDSGMATSDSSGIYGSTNLGGSSSHHNANNRHNNRGKHNNYTPGGERGRNNVADSGGGGGGGGRGAKANNEFRTRHPKKQGDAMNGGKHLDNPLGPGNNNVYQTQMVPDGSSATSSASSISSHYHGFYFPFTASTRNNHFNNINIPNNIDKANSIVTKSNRCSVESALSQFKKQFLYYFHSYCNPLPIFIAGWGLLLQMLQISRRHWFLFLLL